MTGQFGARIARPEQAREEDQGELRHRPADLGERGAGRHRSHREQRRLELPAVLRAVGLPLLGDAGSPVLRRGDAISGIDPRWPE
jgi:hypothetical protein